MQAGLRRDRPTSAAAPRMPMTVDHVGKLVLRRGGYAPIFTINNALLGHFGRMGLMYLDQNWS